MRTRWILPIVVALALVGAIVMTSGSPAATPNPPGAFSFAVFGDAPYYRWEEWRYRLMLPWMDAHDLSAIINIGDIFWRPCSDARYQRSFDEFDAMQHPVVFTPGDNEWTDCWQREPGGYRPLERLTRLRQIFFSDPAHSLGRRRIVLVAQNEEFVENARWEHERIVFATIHVVGSGNGTRPFPGRTAADDDEVRRRTAAAVGWVGETFANAAARNAAAVVIAFHASPGFEHAAADDYRRPFEPILTALAAGAARFGKPVLLVHGDDHEFIVDRPFPNVTRMEVPGSPDVGWVRVIVRPDAADPFAFERHVVPRWKYW